MLLVLNDRSYYFFSSSVLLKDFNSRKLKVVKYDCGDRDVYHLDYAKDTNNFNPLYLIIPKVIAFIEEREGRKYLNFAPAQVNEDVLNDYECMWHGIMERVEKVDGCDVNKCDWDYCKTKVGNIRCEDDDDGNENDLPLDKLIKFNAMTISCRLLVKKSNKFYPEVYLEETLYDDYWSNL